MRMKVGEASGWQAALLVFAVTLLAVPLGSLLLGGLAASREEEALVRQALPFLMGALLILAVPGLRRATTVALGVGFPRGFGAELALVASLKLAVPFAAVLALGVWTWLDAGLPGIERRLAMSAEAELARAASPAGAATWLLVFVLAAPVLEELAFRGFIQRGFQRRWGWMAATLMSSTLFGLYHPHFASAFLSSILLACVLRRAGTLWAPIAVHAFGNLMLWYPLAGQLLLPRRGEATSPETWTLHVACAAVAAFGIPAYVALARFLPRRREEARAVPVELHAALPR
jgi:hypothetical protein